VPAGWLLRGRRPPVAERHGHRKWLPDGGWRLKEEKNVEPKDVGTFSKTLTNIFTKMVMNFFGKCWIQHFCLHKCWCNLLKNAEEGEKYRSNISKKMLQHFAKCCKIS
jgi:hypothetical protein